MWVANYEIEVIYKRIYGISFQVGFSWCPVLKGQNVFKVLRLHQLFFWFLWYHISHYPRSVDICRRLPFSFCLEWWVLAAVITQFFIVNVTVFVRISVLWEVTSRIGCRRSIWGRGAIIWSITASGNTSSTAVSTFRQLSATIWDHESSGKIHSVHDIEIIG